MTWLKTDDYVIIKSEWFLTKAYRLKKGINAHIFSDACRDGLLQVVAVSPQGLSLRLKQTPKAVQRWRRNWPLLASAAAHAKEHPVVFSSRRVTR